MTQWGIDTLFNPAKRHMDEEKRRLQSTRQQIGDNSGGKRIDLESGRVKIERADGDADDAAGGENAAGAEDAADGAAATAGNAEPPAKAEKAEKAEKAAKGKRAKGSGEPSAAAKRAAARRGRTLE